MPATEQTWRNLKLMHVFFGVSGIAMLVTTVWMLAADHTREWKPIQRKFRAIEAWYANARKSEQQTADYEARTKELEEALDQTRTQVPPASGLQRFLDETRAPVDVSAVIKKSYAEANGYDLKKIEDAYAQLQQAAGNPNAPQPIIAAHDRLIEAMEKTAQVAQFVEDQRSQQLKFAKADLSVAVSIFNLAVGKETDDQLAELQKKVDAAQIKVDELTVAYQDANRHRLALRGTLDELDAQEIKAKKDLADHKSKLTNLEKALAERELTVKKDVLTLPILSAFNDPLKIENQWLPKLTLNNNFRDVARFDRCSTCHLGMDKTAPGSAVEPGYPLRGREALTLYLETPPKDPHQERDAAGEPVPVTYERVYGIQLASQGLINESDATVSVVRPRSAGARVKNEQGRIVGLNVGDVIEKVNDVKIIDHARADRYLLGEGIEWGKPRKLSVRRGLPNPFASHPRLDLFLGSTSPHKLTDFGCTICHDGQGSATEFKYASHTPNSPREMRDWKDEYSWFNNHHWIYPMRPARYAESNCLKCHHEMTELAPSERFPDPPAPRLMAGYDVIRTFGCFGCHEIQGYDGPHKRRGPDIRTEPNFAAAASQVLADPKITAHERELARDVVDHPSQTKARKLLAELINQDKPAADKPAAEAKKSEEKTAEQPPRLSPATHRMADLLGADDEAPGTYRKVGPSLRYVASKVNREFLYSWIKNPTDFRPTTRMPRYFGLWDHLKEPEEDAQGNYVFHDKLDANGKPVLDAQGHPIKEPKYVENKGLAEAQRFEPVEIRAIAEYLFTASQPFAYLDKPAGVTEAPSAERGKVLFQTRGCLACHEHKDFPEAVTKLTRQGPNLSRIGDKLKTAEGKRWLYTWVREPSRYHARTKMPVLFLEPITHPDGKVTDAAADVTAYLLTSQDGWQTGNLPEVDDADMAALARIHLEGSFSRTQAADFSVGGIPKSMQGRVSVEEALLVMSEPRPKKEDFRSADQWQEKLHAWQDDFRHHELMYLGRRTITKQGCNGCHDIPGYEDAKPIGTGLADWGRKDPSKLAFEQIVQYLQQQHQLKQDESGLHLGHSVIDPHEMGDFEGYSMEALLNHERDGFIWQKLREPRSYDYKTTENKIYTDRLRMPKFNLTEDQIEEVITFVLGLVAEPPAAQYLYKGDSRQQAILKGKRVLTDFNCASCHTLKQSDWDFSYDPATFENPPEFKDFAFLKPHFTPKELEDSKKVNRAGLGHAHLLGVANPNVQEDDNGKPLYYFGVWQATAINGQVWPVGDGDIIPVPESSIISRRPQQGGNFARYLFPVALALEKASGGQVALDNNAWGWLPPPLAGEGKKVQTQWLHDFLLNPYPIRPAAVLRMPKFNLSSEDASQLVDYFAAIDDAAFPYESDRRTLPGYLAEQNARHPNRLSDAMKLITDSNYCVKCHKLGDFTPNPPASAWAPNLDRVYQRLRPEWLHRWVASPARILPYTAMPQNFKPGALEAQQLYKGTSEEQINAVVDLLLNYDVYMKDQKSYKDSIKPAPPPAAAAGN
jgi:hypothetical protein